MTRVFGILGFPVEHSLSPIMHAAAFQALGLDAIYAPFAVPPRKLAAVLRGLEVAGVDGLNVTVPHKEQLFRSLGKRVDCSASSVGAVNTLIRQNKQLVGYNTDLPALLSILSKRVRLRFKKHA